MDRTKQNETWNKTSVVPTSRNIRNKQLLQRCHKLWLQAITNNLPMPELPRATPSPGENPTVYTNQDRLRICKQTKGNTKKGDSKVGKGLREVTATTWAPPQDTEEMDERGREIRRGRSSSWRMLVPSCPSVPAPQLQHSSSASGSFSSPAPFSSILWVDFVRKFLGSQSS